MEWIELSINNIPFDFVENCNYKVQELITENCEWTPCDDPREIILHNMTKNKYIKYRYQLLGANK